MNSFMDTLRQLGALRLGIIGGIVVALLVFFIFVSMRVSSPEHTLLYTELSTADSNTIAAKLEENSISYSVSPDGTSVSVAEDQVGRARMLLAQEGLPNGGSLGYELFDEQSGFGTTNFVQNINQVRAMEGELSRTISSLENVRTARVHIVLPQRELFSRDSRESSASVFLSLPTGAELSRSEIVAIQYLVASAVPDLDNKNVSIVDNNGNLLAQGGDNEEDLMSLKAEELRRNFESRLTRKIEDQVSRIVGFGNVRAVVTAEMNFYRISTNEELYDPESQVVRSTQLIQENSTEREPLDDNVSVANNLPGVGGDLLSNTAPTAENARSEEVTNFEISRTVRNTVRESGETERLSISVLVDGRYNIVTNDETGQSERVYEPRAQEELDQIAALVRSAAGFDERRGDTIEVVNMQFASIETEDDFFEEDLLFGFNKSDLLDTAEIITVAIMIILVVLLVLQPMIGRLMSPEADEDELLEADLLASMTKKALEAPDQELESLQQEEDDDTMINIQGVDGKVKASTIRKVEEIVEAYPAETVAVIRSWMTQEAG